MPTRSPHLLASTLVVAACLLVLPAAASATPQDVIRDCVRNGGLTQDHSEEDKRRALEELSAEERAYTDCEAIISSEIGSGKKAKGAANSDGSGSGGGSASGGGSGGSGDAAPGASRGDEDGKARDSASGKGKRQLARADTEELLGDREVTPDTVGAVSTDDGTNGLSLPVLLALISLLLLLTAGALYALQRRNPAFAQALRRVSLPRRRS